MMQATSNSSLDMTLETLKRNVDALHCPVPYMFSICEAVATARGSSDKWTGDVEQILQLMIKPGDMHVVQRCYLAAVVLLKQEHSSKAIQWILRMIQASDDVNNFLKSISLQTLKPSEIIIIDQNENDILSNLISKWKHQLNIIHKRVNFK